MAFADGARGALNILGPALGFMPSEVNPGFSDTLSGARSAPPNLAHALHL